jgi:hypothetical protein
LVQDTRVTAYFITITSVKGTVKDKSMPLLSPNPLCSIYLPRYVLYCLVNGVPNTR